MIVLSSSVDSDLVAGIGARLGAGVDVFTTVSEARYRRWSAGGVPSRLALRALGWVAHPVRLALRLLAAPRGTVFIVTTNPFFAPALAVWLGGWRRHRVVHHVFDLYPDALEAAGVLRIGGWRSRAIAALTRSVQRRCAGAVYLGPGLRRHAENRHGRAALAAVIDVAADETLFGEPATAAAETPLTLHYGGQLGRMHDAAALADAVRRLRPEREAGRVRFDFRVGGANAGQLLALDGEPGVAVGRVMPAEAWRRAARDMHVGLVTLTQAGAAVCLPSKTYALLAAGIAVLAVAPAESDLARIVEETGAGWVIDNAADVGGPAGGENAAATGARLAALVRRLIDDAPEVRARRRAARRAATTRFGAEETAGKWRQFLARIR